MDREYRYSHETVVDTRNNFEENNSGSLPVMKPDEQITVLAEKAYEIANYWAGRTEPGLEKKECVMGAVHDVLGMFQNGRDDIPAMMLTPLPPSEEYGEVTQIERNNTVVAVDWAYDQPMHLKMQIPDGPAGYGVDKGCPPASLTYRFQELYEDMRDRYRASAEALFGGDD